jgi:hypothetical protein
MSWSWEASGPHRPKCPSFDPAYAGKASVSARLCLTDAITLVTRGDIFIKHSRSGDPHERRVSFRMDTRMLSYTSDVISMADMTSIVSGKTTAVMRNTPATVPSDCCWSVVTAKRTLDLQAKTEMQRDEWSVRCV